MKPTTYIEKDNARTISGILRPSGRFSVCQIFPKKSKVLNHGKKIQETPGSLRSVSSLDASYAALSSGDLSCLQKMPPNSGEVSGSVGSSIAPNSNISAKRGSMGITSRQRDLLCWSANSLERVYRQCNMSFLTYTLPDLAPCDLQCVQDNWSRIVNTVLIYLQRELKNARILTAIVGCSELQMERYESSGCAYPHLHLVFRGRFHSRADWAVKPKRLRDIWRRCVGRFINASLYSWEASENVEQVRKSAGGYLAKYVSKCGSKQGMGHENTWHPSDWIVCSRRLRALYEQLTYKSYELGMQLLSIVYDWRAGMGYKQPIVISTPAYGDRTIGQWGWLKGEERFPTFASLHLE